MKKEKIAMGHKADDHEEQSQNWTMTMGYCETDRIEAQALIKFSRKKRQSNFLMTE